MLAVNYRSGVGYGAAFRLCEGCMSQGGAEYFDVRSAARVLTGANASSPPLPAGLVPRGRGVGVWGISYGGLNALQAIARDSGLFAAGVSNAGIFNFVSELRYVTDTGIPTYHLDAQPPFPARWRALETGPMPHLATPSWGAEAHARLEVAYASSPAAFVPQMKSPLLIIQGDADEEVDFQESVGMVRALRAAGVEPELLVVPDEAHGIAAYSNTLMTSEAMRAFFDAHLPKGR